MEVDENDLKNATNESISLASEIERLNYYANITNTTIINTSNVNERNITETIDEVGIDSYNLKLKQPWYVFQINTIFWVNWMNLVTGYNKVRNRN